MVRPVLDTLSATDGVELRRGCSGARKGALKQGTLDPNTGFGFPGCETMDTLLTPPPASLLTRKAGPTTEFTTQYCEDWNTMYQRNIRQREDVQRELLRHGIPEHKTEAKPLHGQNHAKSQEEAWGKVRKHQVWGYGGQYRVKQ